MPPALIVTRIELFPPFVGPFDPNEEVGYYKVIPSSVVETEKVYFSLCDDVLGPKMAHLGSLMDSFLRLVRVSVQINSLNRFGGFKIGWVNISKQIPKTLCLAFYPKTPYFQADTPKKPLFWDPNRLFHPMQWVFQ